MLLGGGVFSNKRSHIAWAISVAYELLTDYERSLVDVRILVWNGDPREGAEVKRLMG